MDIIDSLITRLSGEKTVATGKNFYVLKRGDLLILKHKGFITYSELRLNALYTGAYYDLFLPLPSFYENPKILMIGLGLGTIAHQLNQTYKIGSNLDVVEIEEDMIETSKRFLPNENYNIINGDGAEFIKHSKRKYDIIILDAFDGPDIPHIFLTKEFVEDSYAALKEDGILAINSLTQYKNYDDILKKKFKLFRLRQPVYIGNRVLICTKSLHKDYMSDKTKSSAVKGNSGIVKAFEEMEEL